MKIKNLKIYASALAIVAGLSLSPVGTLNVHAEDEVLFEDTEDDYTLEDIPEDETPAVIEETPSTDVSSGSIEETTPETTSVETQSTVDWENTTIDPEDEKYDTGRTEIPDYVATEWERKHPTTPEEPEEPSTPDTPEEPEEPSTPTTPETPDTPETTTVTETTPEPTVIPKTGITEENAFAIGGALGLIGAAAIGLRAQIEMDRIPGGKVTGSRKKYRKNDKKKSR